MIRILLLLTLFVFHSQAQDTIRFKNGEIKAVKVNEVGLNEIKYNKFDNLEGPLYVSNKNEISSIKYSNGQVETFSTSNSNTTTQPSNSKDLTTNDQILIRKGKLIYHSKPLGEFRLHKMPSYLTDTVQQNKMKSAIREMDKYKIKQYLYGFIGLGIAIISIPVGVIAGGVTGEISPFFASILVGAGVGVTGQIISSRQKRMRLEHKMKAVRIFNGEQ